MNIKRFIKIFRTSLRDINHRKTLTAPKTAVLSSLLTDQSTRHIIYRSHLVTRIAGHGVEGRAILEPLNLGLVEGVAELDVE